MKVHVGGRVVHTGQVFFDERITAAVYRNPPYRSRGQADTPHATDRIFAQAGGPVRSSASARRASRATRRHRVGVATA